MSTYATNADVEQRMTAELLAKLTDQTPYEAGDVEAVRQQAHSEVNSYLAARYSVPIDTAAHAELAGVLKAAELDLVEYLLWKRKGQMVPPRIDRQYDRRVAWLIRISSGQADLPADGSLAASQSAGLVADSDGPERRFTRDDLDGLL
jgi:phage gp36-like protein